MSKFWCDCDFHYQVKCLMPNHAYNLLNIYIYSDSKSTHAKYRKKN